MKILMLNYEYPPLGGGQGNANKYIFEEFNRSFDDVEIDIITSSVDAAKVEEYKIGKIYYLDIGKRGENIHHQSISNLLKNAIKTYAQTRKLFKTQKYDLIVAWSGVPSGFIAYVLRFFFKTPYIVLLRGVDVPFYEERWRVLDRLFFCWASPLVWRCAKSVIANSQKLRDLAYKSSRKTPIDVITNGIDTEIFKPDAGKRTSNKTVILGVGRLIPRKGFDLLIQAASQIHTADYEIWLVGDGPEKDRLQNEATVCGIADRVKFLGIRSGEALVEAYQQATIFCLPTYNEGMSNAVLEAIACGLPVVTTNVGGSDELIDGNGFIVECGDIDALKNSLEKLLGNPALIAEYATQSRKMAQTMSWQNIARKMYAAMGA